MFIARWRSSGAAERANYQLFLSELCDVLGAGVQSLTNCDNEVDTEGRRSQNVSKGRR
jgi:hypothetical protein